MNSSSANSLGREKLSRYGCALGFAVLIVIGLIWRFDVANRSIEFDEGLFLYTADRVLQGAGEYTDQFDNMPPGIYYLYILSIKIFGNTPVAAHLTSVLSDVGIIIALTLIGSLLAGINAGLLSAALYSFCFVFLRWAPKGSTENPMTFFLLIALGFYLLAMLKAQKLRPALLLVAGLFIGAAAQVKQPAVFFWLTILLHLAYRVRYDRLKVKEAVLEFTWMLSGFFIIFGIVGAWLAGHGILGAAIYNGLIFPMSAQYEYGMSLLEKWQVFLMEGLRMMPFFIAIGTGSALALLKSHNRISILPIFYCVPVLFFLVWTGDMYQHYLIQLAPGLALAAGLLFSRYWAKPKAIVLLGLLLGLFVFANATRIQQGYISSTKTPSRIFPTVPYLSHIDQRLSYQQFVGAYLKNHLNENETLVTTTPTYAYLAGVPNAYRFFYIAPLTRAASESAYADLSAAISNARFFVLETRRAAFLPESMAQSIRMRWRFVDSIYEPDQGVEVWENPRFAQPNNH